MTGIIDTSYTHIRTYPNNKKYYYQAPIRSIIMDGMKREEWNEQGEQIYRVVLDDRGKEKLIYGKGKVNFNLNLIKDGSNNEISCNYKKNFSYIAYYGEGLVRDVYFPNVDYWSSESPWFGEDISLISLKSSEAIFKGWWTEPDGGVEITNVSGTEGNINKSIFKNTDLFNYKEEVSLPEITLYAHWELKKFKVKVHNLILKGKGKTSFIYEGTRTDKNITLELDYGTEIISYVNNKIKDPTYITWAYDQLDGLTILNQSGTINDLFFNSSPLRNGVQKFLGWTLEKPYNRKICQKFLIKENIDLYPQFQALVVWKKAQINNKIYGGTFQLISPTSSSFWRYLNDEEILLYSFPTLGNIYEKYKPKCPKKYKDEKGRWHSFQWSKIKIDYSGGTEDYYSSIGLDFSVTVVFILKEFIN